VLAPDSFQESMTAKEVCIAMEKGINKADPAITCIHVPMADGGEGTMQSLVDATGGNVFSLKVLGPFGNEVDATYGITGDGETGVLEMASASGIHLVAPEARNPLISTTYGTGQLIKACCNKELIRNGCNRERIRIPKGGPDLVHPFSRFPHHYLRVEATN
jgi:glycerate kinase